MFARAAVLYRQAAEAGLAWAQYNLGHLLLDGSGVARDRDAAFLWYMRAATQGHERAMNLVARCFEQGWGVARDATAARNWYRQSAEGGYFRGAYNYATILSRRRLHRRCGALVPPRAGRARRSRRKDNIRRALARHPDPRRILARSA